MRAFRSIVPALALALGASPGAKAAPITAGFDLFTTGPSQLVIPNGPCMNGCTFQGFPISPGTTGPGNTDNIVQRTGSLPDGGTGPIASQLVELSLKSTSPVNIAGSFFDVFVTLNALPGGLNNIPVGPPQYDALPASTGTTTVLTNNGTSGGTFSASYTVNADVILTVRGGDPSNPAQVTSHSPLPSFTETIQGTWHPPGPCVPNTGPGTAVCQNGGFSPTPITVISGPLAWSPATVPDPSTALLFGSGLVGLAVAGRRRP
jgi:hypothetical protein